MRIVLQRVTKAQVTVGNECIGSVGLGYVLLVGVMKGDTEQSAQWLAEKISKLRLFDGPDGKVNDRSIIDMRGEVLVVSQFTLGGDVRKGNRPDYTAAEAPARAQQLYQYFVHELGQVGIAKVATGEFGAHMHVELVNDGPVTILLSHPEA